MSLCYGTYVYVHACVCVCVHACVRACVCSACMDCYLCASYMNGVMLCCGVVWCGAVRCGAVRCVWCGVVQCGVCYGKIFVVSVCECLSVCMFMSICVHAYIIYIHQTYKNITCVKLTTHHRQ